MKKIDKLRDWVRNKGCILESQVTASGLSKELNELLLAREVDMAAHPTVKDKGGAPASAVVWKKEGER